MKVQARDAEDFEDVRKKYKDHREWWDKVGNPIEIERLKAPYIVLLQRCIEDLLWYVHVRNRLE